MIDKMFEIGLLYDFYSELLTPHQKRISQLYFEDNYTLAEIADVTGVSRQAVSKWETGAADPSTANLLALAKLYGVPAEELLRGTRGDAG